MPKPFSIGDSVRYYAPMKGFYVRGRVFDIMENGDLVIDSGTGVLHRIPVTEVQS